MITVNQMDEGNVLLTQAIDRLVASDYEILVSKCEELLSRFDRINMLVELRDFKGWSAGALWQDLKFDVKHFKDIERLAIVGKKKWGEELAIFSKAFTAATVRYFALNDFETAVTWVKQKP